MIYQSYGKHVAITKSDTVNFDGSNTTGGSIPQPADAIYVGTAGVVVAVTQDGNAVPYTAIAGAIIPGRFIRVNSTNTVPTLMNALYYV